MNVWKRLNKFINYIDSKQTCIFIFVHIYIKTPALYVSQLNVVINEISVALLKVAKYSDL